MSSLLDDGFDVIRQAGKLIADRLAMHDQRLRGVIQDTYLQLGAIRAEVTAERRIAEDRHEMVMRRFDALDRVEKLLTTNGSGGGGHG